MDSSTYRDECPAGLDGAEGLLPLPLDMSHHFTALTKQRQASKMKQYYKFFQLPGIGNLAGGLPNVSFFPFDTLEAQTAKPERWPPLTHAESGSASNSSSSGLLSRFAAATLSSPAPASSDSQAPAHIAVPKTCTESDPLKKIDLASALQYGQANGYPALLSWIDQFAKVLHPSVPYRGGADVSLACGSTDGMSKAVEILIEPWSEARGDDVRDRPGVLCEVFAYNSALNQAMAKGAQIIAVAADEGGMSPAGPGGLEDVLENWDFARGKRPNVMYMVTMGHNPTGIVLTLERRKAIYALCHKYDVIIIEDEPYWYLQYPSAEQEEAKSRNQTPPEPAPQELLAQSSGYPYLDSLVPSFLNIDTDGRVIRLDTFSKTVAPGCRLGWVTAQPAIIEKVVRVAETSTQQPSGFVQSLVAELVIGPQPEAQAAFQALRSGKERAAFAGWKLDGWVRWLEGLRGMYERRMVRMCTILDNGAFQLKTGTPLRPADAEWGVVTKTRLLSFDWPRGGMFVWVRVYLEAHPLWGAVLRDGSPLLGPRLAVALMLFLTHKPARVAVAVGSMFAADDTIQVEHGWKYFRLCFAAEAEDLVDACSQRFVDGVHRFWRIKDVATLQELLDELPEMEATEQDDDVDNLGMYMGC